MIRKLITSMCLLTTTVSLADLPCVTAEDLHFMEYRVLMIESSAEYINQLLDQLVADGDMPADAANEIRQYVAWMVLNAGCYDLKRSGN